MEETVLFKLNHERYMLVLCTCYVHTFSGDCDIHMSNRSCSNRFTRLCCCLCLPLYLRDHRSSIAVLNFPLAGANSESLAFLLIVLFLFVLQYFTLTLRQASIALLYHCFSFTIQHVLSEVRIVLRSCAQFQMLNSFVVLSEPETRRFLSNAVTFAHIYVNGGN